MDRIAWCLGLSRSPGDQVGTMLVHDDSGSEAFLNVEEPSPDHIGDRCSFLALNRSISTTNRDKEVNEQTPVSQRPPTPK